MGGAAGDGRCKEEREGEVSQFHVGLLPDPGLSPCLLSI